MRVRGLDCSVEELEFLGLEMDGFLEEFGQEGVSEVGGEEVRNQCAGGVGCYVDGGVEVEGATFAG